MTRDPLSMGRVPARRRRGHWRRPRGAAARRAEVVTLGDRPRGRPALTAADAVITKAYPPILGLGAVGGAVIGWLVGRFGH
jgi:hypothetical protein